MTNFEYYKGDAEAFRNAFIDYCDKHDCEHAGCRFFTDADKYCNGMEGCVARFICAEHEEPKPRMQRRLYLFSEAKKLLGKRLDYEIDGRKYAEIITHVSGYEDGISINDLPEDYYLRNNATIDGEPFGVEVAE